MRSFTSGGSNGCIPNLKNSPLGDWRGLTGEYEDKDGETNYYGEDKDEDFSLQRRIILRRGGYKIKEKENLKRKKHIRRKRIGGRNRKGRGTRRRR